MDRTSFLIEWTARILALMSTAATWGCKEGGDAPVSDGPATTSPQGPSPAAATVPSLEKRTVADRLLGWLDPDATLAGYAALPENIDVKSLCLVYGLPPRAEKVLRDLAGLRDDLEAVSAPDQPEPEVWLGRESLVMMPAVATGTYAVRSIIKPRAEVEAILLAAGMRIRIVEGFTMLEPSGAFPWKVVFLEDDLIAFIPVREIGSGLGPLTAGRDLPASDTEHQLRKVLEQERGVMLELFAHGPLVHLDLGRDVIGVRFALRDIGDGRIDGAILLQVAEDATEAADSLHKRGAPLEPQTIQNLVRRVAFTTDGPFVTGRLQLEREDVATLTEAS